MADTTLALGGNLLQCRRCGALRLKGWGGLTAEALDLVDRALDSRIDFPLYTLPLYTPSGSDGSCKEHTADPEKYFIPVAYSSAASSTGLSEAALLQRIHDCMSERSRMYENYYVQRGRAWRAFDYDAAKAMVAEVERRLNILHGARNLPPFRKSDTADVNDAVAIIHAAALPATPIISEPTVAVEYLGLTQTSVGWEEGFKAGTVQEVIPIVRKNLERDTTDPRGFNKFTLDVKVDDWCGYAVVFSFFTDRARAYRLWRASELVFFCGSNSVLFR
jgi:hypothetical protein